MPSDAGRAPRARRVHVERPVSWARPAIPMGESYNNRTRCSDSGLRPGCPWLGCRRAAAKRPEAIPTEALPVR